MTFASLAIFELDQNDCTSFKRFSLRGAAIFSDLIAGVLSNKTREKIGVVDDILVDKLGQPEYLVVELGGSSGRKVLLPADRSWIDHKRDRVYAAGLSRREAEMLPEYNK